jgi:ADP-ribose pyrophosphatase YjhB (NUDIX family)
MDDVTHFIDRAIIKALTYGNNLRFRDMRPENVDSNLYTYHLNSLIKSKYIEKTAGGYRLAPKGLAYVDLVSTTDFRPSKQPKICTAILLKNNNGEILLTKRTRQPLIGLKGLPTGKIHLEERLDDAAARELKEKTGLENIPLRRFGFGFHHVYDGDYLISAAEMHVYGARVKSVAAPEGAEWTPVKKLCGKDIIPGVAEIFESMHSPRNRFFELTYRI